MHCSRVDAFRHRAEAIIADPARAGHSSRRLTLTPLWLILRAQIQNECRATKVMRHGLCPILECAREPVNPARTSFAVMSASL